MIPIGDITGDNLMQQVETFPNEAARQAYVPLSSDKRRLFVVADTGTYWAYIAGRGWIELDT